MRALRPDANMKAFEISDAPYPSWSSIADGLASCRGVPAQDSQALRETRIWRALAEEPSANDQAGIALSTEKAGSPLLDPVSPPENDCRREPEAN